MKSILVLAAVLVAFAAHAMKLEVSGNVVYASGPVENDLREFQEALAKPGVDTVAFVNSPGGDLWTGLTIGRMIAGKGFKTVTAGFCISACSIMFMGGRERSFSDVYRPAQTFVGIHGAHMTDTKGLNPQIQPQIYAFYKQNMGPGFNADVMNTALYDMQDAGALLRVFDAARLPKRPPFHCKSVQSLRKDCTEFKELDALSLGIVTTNAFTALKLPAGLLHVPSLLGRELTQALPDAASYYKEQGERKCSADACRKSITDFAAAQENRALAFPVDGPGFGSSFNRDNGSFNCGFRCNWYCG